MVLPTAVAMTIPMVVRMPLPPLVRMASLSSAWGYGLPMRAQSVGL